MYTYVCCRCTNCAAQILLENREDPNSNLLHRVPRPRAGREACPYCRTVFVPQSYYIKESTAPLASHVWMQAASKS
jgi:hypothetical protein